MRKLCLFLFFLKCFFPIVCKAEGIYKFMENITGQVIGTFWNSQGQMSYIMGTTIRVNGGQEGAYYLASLHDFRNWDKFQVSYKGGWENCILSLQSITPDYALLFCEDIKIDSWRISLSYPEKGKLTYSMYYLERKSVFDFGNILGYFPNYKEYESNMLADLGASGGGVFSIDKELIGLITARFKKSHRMLFQDIQDIKRDLNLRNFDFILGR